MGSTVSLPAIYLCRGLFHPAPPVDPGWTRGPTWPGIRAIQTSRSNMRQVHHDWSTGHPPPGHVNPDWLIAGVPYDQGFQWKPIGFPKKKGRLSSEGVCLGGWLTSHDLRVVHCLAGIWVCWSSLRFCLVGDLFMELYHGIHDHFSPPFGRICLELFSKHHGQAKSKFKSWEFEATPFPKDTAGQKFRDEKTTHTYFPIYRHPVILSWLGCPITSETNI